MSDKTTIPLKLTIRNWNQDVAIKLLSLIISI